MKKYLLFFIISVCCVLVIISCGDDKNPVNAGNLKRLTEISRFKVRLGEVQAVVVRGNYAYIADVDNGLHIVDITDKKYPEEKIVYGENSRPWQLFGKDNYLFMTGIEISGMDILDISSPLAPTKISNINVGGYVEDILFRDTLMFIAAYEKGLLVYNIKDIQNPEFISSYKDDYDCRITGVDIIDQTAYLADEYYAFRVVDISYLDTLKQISLIPMDNEVSDICVKNNYAYLACGNLGLSIYNIENPKKTIEVGSFKTDTSRVHTIEIFDNLVYVADYRDLFYILNVIDVSSPAIITSFSATSSVYGFYVDGDYIFLAAGGDGMYILEYK